MSPSLYVAAMAVALVFCIGSVLVYSPPMRTCLQCGRRLAVTARRCRHCGYRASD